MFLLAIGIYKKNDLTRLDSAQQTNSYSFWESNLLDQVEKQTLTQFCLNPEIPQYFQINTNEHHFIKQSNTNEFIIVLVSRKKLFDSEPYYLFRNVEEIFLKKINASLKDVINNPLEFINDKKLKTLQEKLEVTKNILFQTTLALHNRTVSLKNLETSSINLKTQGDHFRNEANKVNSCFCL